MGVIEIERFANQILIKRRTEKGMRRDDLAVFSKFKRVTTITLAGHATILIVSAKGAGVGAQIGSAIRT